MAKIKRGSVQGIKDRFNNIEDLYPLVEESKEKNCYESDEFSYMFNYKLTIKVPGAVIADSRPRGLENITLPNMRRHKYNPNKDLLIKIFNQVYSNSLLEDITIFSPMKLDIKIHSKMTKKYMDFKNKLKLEMHIPYISFPDVDNVAKVFYDVLQDSKYQVIFKDNYIFDSNISKVYSDREYVEINIYFNKNLSIFEEYVVNSSTEMFYYLISYKYIKNKVLPSDYIKHVITQKEDKKIKLKPNKLKYTLKHFPKEYLSGITNTNIAHTKQIGIIIDSIMKGDD